MQIWLRCAKSSDQAAEIIIDNDIGWKTARTIKEMNCAFQWP